MEALIDGPALADKDKRISPSRKTIGSDFLVNKYQSGVENFSLFHINGIK